MEPRCLAQALEAMEDAWPEGEEHMAKLSVNALIGLWARNQELVYSMRTSNHELDGQGCQWRQTFTDAAGKVHWDHIYATELFSNYTLRPLHDYVMAQEHVAVAKIRDHLRKVPPRYVVALKTDCLVFQDLPKKFLPAVRELTARKHQDGTPVYRFEECKRLEREPRIEAPYLTSFAPEWRSVEDPLLHCLNGKSLLLSGMPGTGKTHLARQIVAQLCELGEVVKLVSKTHCSVQNLGAGAQTADRFVRKSIRNGSCELDRLVIEEITQLGLQPLGRHRGGVPEPEGQVPPPGRFPAAVSGAGRLRGRAGGRSPSRAPGCSTTWRAWAAVITSSRRTTGATRPSSPSSST